MREMHLDPANPSTAQAQANWVADYISRHRGSLSQWRGLPHGLERIRRGQVHPFDTVFGLHEAQGHHDAKLHGAALRHMFGHPHQNRESAVPPASTSKPEKQMHVYLDNRLVGKMVERAITHVHKFAHGTADHDGRTGVPHVDYMSIA
jgi:hypothetical protein